MAEPRKPIGSRTMRRDAADLKSTAGRGRDLLTAVYRATDPAPSSATLNDDADPNFRPASRGRQAS